MTNGTAKKDGAEGGKAKDGTPRRVLWPLIILGVAVIVAGIVLRGHRFPSGTTKVVQTGATSKTTTTTSAAPPSDNLLLGLLGIGAAFVLCGAFYGRISKVTFPGGAIEFLDAQKEAAVAVERAVERRDDQADIEPPAQVAATMLAAARAIEIQRLAQPIVVSAANAAEKGFDAKSLVGQARLSREMWDQIADEALNEILARKTD